jgi:hypothetical protein
MAGPKRCSMRKYSKMVRLSSSYIPLTMLSAMASLLLNRMAAVPIEETQRPLSSILILNICPAIMVMLFTGGMMDSNSAIIFLESVAADSIVIMQDFVINVSNMITK